MASYIPIRAIIITTSDSSTKPHYKIPLVYRAVGETSSAPAPPSSNSFNRDHFDQNWKWRETNSNLTFWYVSQNTQAPDIKVQLWSDTASVAAMLESVETLQRYIDRMAVEFMESDRETSVIAAYDWDRSENTSVFGKLIVYGTQTRTMYYW
jgi:hypothetical protein